MKPNTWQKIGQGWYEIVIPGKGRAGVRFYGKNNWSYYVRNEDHSLPDGWSPGVELYAPSFVKAKKAALDGIKAITKKAA